MTPNEITSFSERSSKTPALFPQPPFSGPIFTPTRLFVGVSICIQDMRRREEDLQRKRDEKRRLEDEARALERNYLVCGRLVGSPVRR